MASRHLLLSGVSLVLLTASPVSAQDLLAVTWNGATALVNSYTGAVTPLGTGMQGQNCLARDASGTLWSTSRVSSSFHWLTNVNPATGGATARFSGPDLRGLSIGPGNTLYGIRNEIGPDSLVRIDTNTSAVTLIGNTGFADIQGLALHQGVLYAWDVFYGLLVINPVTGAAINPTPLVGGPLYYQSLCSHPDGRLLLGGGDSHGPDALFEVNIQNGTLRPIAQMTGIVDVRGLEPLGGYAMPFGPGCNGVHGQVVLSATGRYQVGGSIATVSSNHAASSLGMILFGFSRTQHLGNPLPLLLDPLFGTSNCRLVVSIDGTAVAFTGAGTPATLQHGFGLPAVAAGLTVHMQHVCFEPVAGGMSWSNGLTLSVE